MSSGVIQAGYPARRLDSCGQDSGNTTWSTDSDQWWVCCPSDLWGAAVNNNEQCETADMDWADTVPSQCANSTWTLWWAAGYFCCEDTLKGFTNPDGYYGCSNTSVINDEVNSYTMATFTGTTPTATSTATSTAASTSATSTTTTTPTHTSSASSKPTSSSPNTGAIAGGVVGGVCAILLVGALIWFLLRRQRRILLGTAGKGNRSSTDSTKPISNPSEPSSHGGTEEIELEGDKEARMEMYDGSSRRNELPADNRSRHELPGMTPRSVEQDSPAELP